MKSTGSLKDYDINLGKNNSLFTSLFHTARRVDGSLLAEWFKIYFLSDFFGMSNIFC